MSNFLLIILCFGLGLFLRRMRRLPANAPDVLNGFIINVSAPAVVVLSIHQTRLDAEVLAPLALPWLLLGAGAVFFRLGWRLFGLPPSAFGAVLLTCAVGNTAFVGFPVVEAFCGQKCLGLAVIYNQSNFLALMLPGLLLALQFSGAGSRGETVVSALRSSVIKLAKFPLLHAIVLGLALHGVELPGFVVRVLEQLAAPLTPVALISVGLGAPLALPHGQFVPLALGLGFKLVAAPALALLACGPLLGLSGDALTVNVLQAATPPIVVGWILAREYDMEPGLASMLLAVGIPLGFATLPLWRLALPGAW